MHRVAMVVVLAAACIRDPNVVCGDLACPAGAVCTPTGCATPDQLAACAGHADGDTCMTPLFATGTCVGGVCQPVQCGDGKLVPPEVCDDGNQRSGDGCSADCRSTEVCGNGYIDALAGEQCDNGLAGLSRDGCTSTCTAEFDSWFDVTPQLPAARFDHAAAYDARNHRMVVFGGFRTPLVFSDTIEWDGRVWRARQVPSPPPNESHALAYDSDRHRIVMFGGDYSGTWEYDGIRWEQRLTSTEPPLRANAGMTYDPIHHQIVLCGGVENNTQFGDTYTWDGTTWTHHVVTPYPMPGRTRLAWDGVNGRVLGYNENTGQTWAWSGSAWTSVAVSGPGVHSFTAMSEAPGGHVLLYGGGINDTETWEWNGATWTNRNPSANPGHLSQHSLAYDSDRGVVIAFGGSMPTGINGDAWEWNGTTWTKPVPDGVPVISAVLSLAYLPTTGKAVSFGDLVDGETWEWDGIAWERATPVVAPQVRQRDGMTATRDRIVMFGGLGISISGGFGPLDETWTYDGTTWTYLPTAHAPSPRTDTALGYDARRDRVVLFGGNGGGETWEWDGTDWTQSLPAHRPPSSNARVAMAYDRHAAVTVVYVTGETWTWDGLDWTQLATNGPNIAVPVITYDPLRQRVVLEGVDRQTFLIGTWEWTGSSWAPLPAVANPNDDAAHQMIYDAAHGEIMLYNSNLRVTWVHRYFSQSVPADECIDRDTDGDGLVGCADPDCAGRCTPGCAPGETCDPSAPHCGDGTCSVLENYRLCPADCAP